MNEKQVKVPLEVSKVDEQRAELEIAETRERTPIQRKEATLRARDDDELRAEARNECALAFKWF